MRLIVSLSCFLSLLLLSACMSAEERAASAQEDVAKQRLALVEKHQNCVEEAAGDQQKIDSCDMYLKEAEALK